MVEGREEASVLRVSIGCKLVTQGAGRTCPEQRGLQACIGKQSGSSGDPKLWRQGYVWKKEAVRMTSGRGAKKVDLAAFL